MKCGWFEDDDAGAADQMFWYFFCILFISAAFVDVVHTGLQSRSIRSSGHVFWVLWEPIRLRLRALWRFFTETEREVQDQCTIGPCGKRLVPGTDSNGNPVLRCPADCDSNITVYKFGYPKERI